MGHRSGEAGQAITCWGGRDTRQARSCAGRQGVRQARPVRPSCAGGVGCQAGEAGQAVMCVRRR